MKDVISTLMVIILAGPAAAQEAGSGPELAPGQGMMAEVWGALQHDGELSGSAAADAVGKIEKLGDEAIPSLIAIAAGKTPRVIREDDEVDRHPDATPLFVTSAQRAVVLRCLQRRDETKVIKELERAEPEPRDLNSSVRVIQLLRDVGRRHSLSVVLDAAGGIAPHLLAYPHVDRSLRAAISEIIVRDVGAVNVLNEHWEELDEKLLLPTLVALAQSRSPLAVELLLMRLATIEEPRLVVGILDVFDQHAAALADKMTIRATERIRAMLGSPEPRLRSAAARAAARIHDQRSVVILIDLLADEDARVRRVAHWALKTMSGRRYEPSRQRWHAWLGAEQVWLDVTWPGLEDGLRLGDEHVVLGSLRRMRGRRLFRLDLMDHVIVQLTSQHASVQREACAVLASLGSHTAVAPLVETLRSADPTVREAAAQALKALTGKKLPAHHAAWEAVVHR